MYSTIFIVQMQKIYIKARVRNVLFIPGAYKTARLNNKKVVLDACGDGARDRASYNDRTVTLCANLSK